MKQRHLNRFLVALFIIPLFYTTNASAIASPVDYWIFLRQYSQIAQQAKLALQRYQQLQTM